jgi:hypothetical protein
MLALLAGLWAGLIRIGWQWPAWQAALPFSHGPLMISGFLGTLIGLERAAALSTGARPGARRLWTYLAPLLTGLGGIALLLGLPAEVGRVLITLGSFVLLIACGLIVRMRQSWDTATMAAGALLWLLGNVLWLSGRSTAEAAVWWIGFLVLTIAGERLELARVLLLKRRALITYLASIAVFLAGLALTLWDYLIGVRVSGVGLIALGAWLLVHDIARRTIRQSGLTRFIAACLLPGYVWLMFAGGLWLFGNFSAGQVYDASLHSVLLGFVFSMIFGHAPIILPAVLNLPVVFHTSFYSHLVLLHASLVLRIIGDLAASPSLRMWAGLLNAIAILLFIFNTMRTLRSQLRSASTT